MDILYFINVTVNKIVKMRRPEYIPQRGRLALKSIPSSYVSELHNLQLAITQNEIKLGRYWFNYTIVDMCCIHYQSV